MEENNTQQEKKIDPTFGEKRVQRSFNPSANKHVETIKQSFANIIDALEEIKNDKNAREISLAQTYAETACLYAVKSLFVE